MEKGLTVRFKHEYNTWRMMIKRCYDVTHNGFEWYGLEFIKVHRSWRYSFEQFLKDMGPRPKGDYQLDRLDGDYGYCKWNCAWVTRRQNLLNRISTVWHRCPWTGQKMCEADLCKKYGVDTQLFRTRLKCGWTIQRAIWEPPQAGRRPIRILVDPFDGEELTVGKLAAKYGIHRETLHARLGKLGWSLKAALTNADGRQNKALRERNQRDREVVAA